jgi:inosose dehydratase
VTMLIGISPDSWGVWFPEDQYQPQWHEFLDEVVLAGYEWIELGPSGYLPANVEVLRRELDSRGLKLAGAHVEGRLDVHGAVQNLEESITVAGEALAALGGSTLILLDETYTDLLTGELVAPERLANDAWKRLVANVSEIANRVVSRWGINVAFHPQADSHVQSQVHIDQLLAETDAAVVSLCLDVGHIAYVGDDPILLIEKYYDRLSYLHLKAVDRTVQARVKREALSFAVAVREHIFVEPSHREAFPSFASVQEKLAALGFDGFGIVEQDMYPAPLGAPLPIARRTRQYLRELGMG